MSQDLVFARPARLGDPQTTSHLYAVECEHRVANPKGQAHPVIEVYANNRDQAARIAKRAGFEVRSVNMIG